MCKTVEKIEEMIYIAKKMAYDLGYKSTDKGVLENPWDSDSSLMGQIWEQGRVDSDNNRAYLPSLWINGERVIITKNGGHNAN